MIPYGLSLRRLPGTNTVFYCTLGTPGSICIVSKHMPYSLIYSTRDGHDTPQKNQIIIVQNRYNVQYFTYLVTMLTTEA